MQLVIFFFCPLNLKNVNRLMNWIRPASTTSTQRISMVLLNSRVVSTGSNAILNTDTLVHILISCWIRTKPQPKHSPKFRELNWNIPIILSKLWNRHLVGAWVSNRSTKRSSHSSRSISLCNLCRRLGPAPYAQPGRDTVAHFHAKEQTLRARSKVLWKPDINWLP